MGFTIHRGSKLQKRRPGNVTLIGFGAHLTPVGAREGARISVLTLVSILHLQ